MPAPEPVTSRHVAKGVGTTLVARLGGVIDIVAQPLYVALFGLPAFGLYTVLWAAVNLAENVADLGMTSALQRSVPQAADAREAAGALRTAMLWGVGPCLVVAALASLAAPSLAGVVNVAAKDAALVAPAIRLFAWALPLWAFVEVATSALRARRLFGPEIRLRLLWEQLARLVLATALWAAGYGITGLLIAHLASLSLTALLALRLLAKHYDLRLALERSSPAIRAATLKAGLSVLPTNIVAQIFTDGPPVLLNLILPGAGGAIAAALFGIARKIASIVQLLRTAFAYVLAPLASAATRGQPGEVRALYAYVTRLTTALALPLACVMAAGAHALLALFGHGAEAAEEALIILLAARLAEAAAGAAKPVQQVVSGYGSQIFASLAGLALAAAIGAVAVPALGLTGMALAVAAGLIAAATIPIVQLWRDEGLLPFDAAFRRTALRALLIATVASVPAVIFSRQLGGWGLALLAPLLLAAIWLSLRFALHREDRLSLGKNTARKLRLV